MFLKSTDQKVRAREWLIPFVSKLENRRLFVDAGAGAGHLTEPLQPQFERTIAIEPNPELRAELEKKVGRAQILSTPIEQTVLADKADLVLCSHVIYLVERARWQDFVRHMASWLAPKGKLVLIAQSPDTDGKRLLREYGYDQSNLRDLQETLPAHRVKVETVPSYVTVPDLRQAMLVARFMLNNPNMGRVPADPELEKFLEKHFRQSDGSYRISCHQDFLVIRG